MCIRDRPRLSASPSGLAWGRAGTPHRPPAPRRRQAAAGGPGAGRIVTAPTPSTGSRWVRLRVDRIKVGERFRKDLGSIDALVDSIREVGLLHALSLIHIS